MVSVPLSTAPSGGLCFWRSNLKIEWNTPRAQGQKQPGDVSGRIHWQTRGTENISGQDSLQTEQLFSPQDLCNHTVTEADRGTPDVCVQTHTGILDHAFITTRQSHSTMNSLAKCPVCVMTTEKRCYGKKGHLIAPDRLVHVDSKQVNNFYIALHMKTLLKAEFFVMNSSTPS